jgi:hypothetical protein
MSRKIVQPTTAQNFVVMQVRALPNEGNTHSTSVGVFASALAGIVDFDYLGLRTWDLAAGAKNSIMPRLMDSSIHLSIKDRNVL